LSTMACYLRVVCADTSVERLIGDISFELVNSWHKGELKVATYPDGGRNRTSGFCAEVSNADLDDLEKAAEDAVRFLNTHGQTMARLCAAEDVEALVLDFSVRWRDTATHSDILPPELCRLAGGYGCSIELSHYPIEEDADE
jgi:hypothetical protein